MAVHYVKRGDVEYALEEIACRMTVGRFNDKKAMVCTSQDASADAKKSWIPIMGITSVRILNGHVTTPTLKLEGAVDICAAPVSHSYPLGEGGSDFAITHYVRHRMQELGFTDIKPFVQVYKPNGIRHDIQISGASDTDIVEITGYNIKMRNPSAPTFYWHWVV